MKYFLTFVLVLSLFSALGFSQTKIWRINDYYDLAVQDANGNTYISRKDRPLYGLDTLVKVSPDGTILWKTPTEAWGHRILLTSNGLYLSPPLHSSGPMYCYDTSGTLQWTYHPKEMSHFASFPAVAQDGSIILAYSTATPTDGNPIASTLIKINRLGEQVFEVTIPTIVPDAYQQIILGPALTDDGNIWVLAQARNASERILPSTHSYKELGFDEAMLFNGTTGQLMIRKNIFKGIVENWSDKSDGSSKSYVLNTASYGGPVKFVTSSGSNLIAGGFWDTQTETRRSNGEYSYISKSEWRMSIVSSGGKLTNFRYRGKGETRNASLQSISKGDESGNELREILVGTDNELYLHGSVSRGKSINGVGTFAYDDVLMRYNIITKKAAWKIVTPNSEAPASYSTYLYQPGQSLLRQENDGTIRSYSSSGAIGDLPLSFAENVVLIPKWERGEYFIESTEPGTIILRGYENMALNAQPFIAKYSIAGLLASQRYTPQASADELDAPESYSLQQNYPNPFNPMTTIEFDLAIDAVVTAKVYNSLGQEVATLIDNEEFIAGSNQVDFNADGFPSGVYYYRLTASGIDGVGIQFSQMKKMMLLK